MITHDELTKLDGTAFKQFGIDVFKRLESIRQVIISRITGDNISTDYDTCIIASAIMCICHTCIDNYDRVCFINDSERLFLTAYNICKKRNILDPNKAIQFMIDILPDIDNTNQGEVPHHANFITGILLDMNI